MHPTFNPTQILSPSQVRADTVVPKAKVGVTPGGVKYFDKVAENTCSPFNPCSPQAGDLVKIKYKSFLSNGAMFDSSENPGRKPLAAKYKASPPQMLPGWEEALEGMQQGQTRIIQVPASMAYGDKGVKVETKDGSTEVRMPFSDAAAPVRHASALRMPNVACNVTCFSHGTDAWPVHLQFLVQPGERLQFELTLVQVALPPP